MVERGSDYEKWKISKNYAVEQYVKNDKLKEEKADKVFRYVYGVPEWVKKETNNLFPVPDWVNQLPEQNEFVPLVVLQESSHVTVKSAVVSYEIYQDKITYYDNLEMSKERATEQISLKIENINDVELEPSGVSDPNYGETSLSITQNYDVKQGDKKIGELYLTYSQEAGLPVRHVVQTKGLADYGKKTLEFTWRFPVEVQKDLDKAIISQSVSLEEQTTKDIPLTSDQVYIDVENVDNLAILKKVKPDKGDKVKYQVWMAELAEFSKPHLKKVGLSNNLVTFVHSSWDKKEIELPSAQTWTNPDPNEDGYVEKQPLPNNNNCNQNNRDKYPTIEKQRIYIGVPSFANSNAGCRRGYIEWDINFNGNILAARFRYHLLNGNPAWTCNARGLGAIRPSTQPNNNVGCGAVWNAVDAGNNYGVNLNMTQGVITLNAQAINDIIAANGGWWAFGLRLANEVRDGGTRFVVIAGEFYPGVNPPPTLELDVA